MAAKTSLGQILPVAFGVVHRDLAPGGDPFRHDDDAFESHPQKCLELTIRRTGMVDESCVIPLSPLPDLVPWILSDLPTHHVHIFEVFGHHADKFADNTASIERLFRLN